MADIAIDSPRGSNQSAIRAYNERLVLTLLHRHGALAKAEIAKVTGLSAQTVSVIMRQLEKDEMILRGEPVRGRVGQPSVPFSLNPEGAFFFGVKVGRRSTEVILTNLSGQILERRSRVYGHPAPEDITAFLTEEIRAITKSRKPRERDRIAGLGIAMPGNLWNWPGVIGVAPEAMEGWRDVDMQALLAQALPFPVYLQNDASAACGAELIFGQAELPSEFLHLYLGYFIGGGVVFSDTAYTGPTGNAGALGSIPVTLNGKTQQLIEIASIHTLEKKLKQHGEDSILTDREDWPIPDRIATEWLSEASEAMAQAIAASCAVVDFPAVVIDGWMPARLRSRMVARVEEALMRQDFTGIAPPKIIEGTLGPEARSLGAAALPLAATILIDTAALQKAI
ncbi:ROK family transcriptional regulator [Paracoccaceae bacterium GXU_MW_L88]